MIGGIADLPFRERDPLELLCLDVDRDELVESTGFGWSRVGALWLSDRRGPARRVDDVLLLALHGAEEGPPLPDDIDLEFYVDPSPDPFLVSLRSFLSVWLPRISSGERAVVLAVCNRHDATLARPPGGAPLHYGLGDVESWREGRDLHLVARAWRMAA